MRIGIRLIAKLALVATLAAAVTAAQAQQAISYRLWTGRAPGAPSESPADTPRLTWLAPAADANGTAVIIAPGGGYVGLAGVLEGTEPASWFTMQGITAFVLQYRVGGTAPLPLPLLDGTRAVRFVRAHAASFHIDPNRIGMLGFSAGGHLTAMTALQATPGDAKANDPVERVSSRPDFIILAYPWLVATELEANGHSPYCDSVVEETRVACRPQDYGRFAPLAYVTRDAPPTFFYLTTDDDQVAPVGSLRLYQALWQHHVPVEMHIFAHGRHASVFGGADPSLSAWPHLLQEWMRSRGLLPPH